MIIDLTLGVEDNIIDDYLQKQENKILAQGHIGTHLDRYNRSNIPLEYFKRNGVLVDVSDIADYREIDISDFISIDINSGHFLIIKTNRINKYNYGTKEYFNNHPVLSNELIQYLIDKKINFIGIDCAGIRPSGMEHIAADKLCESNNIFVIENMANLNKIDSDSFTVYTMWLEDGSATGLRCRVIAEIKEEWV